MNIFVNFIWTLQKICRHDSSAYRESKRFKFCISPPPLTEMLSILDYTPHYCAPSSTIRLLCCSSSIFLLYIREAFLYVCQLSLFCFSDKVPWGEGGKKKTRHLPTTYCFLLKHLVFMRCIWRLRIDSEQALL